uniref:Alternative protein ZNF853 n=1 Tax=Homo sapiens TaxID=9606 RepID=L8E8C2_HUMAN|nr:alternative protein ZNF853 [Homo sapiens]
MGAGGVLEYPWSKRLPPSSSSSSSGFPEKIPGSQISPPEKSIRQKRSGPGLKQHTGHVCLPFEGSAKGFPSGKTGLTTNEEKPPVARRLMTLAEDWTPTRESRRGETHVENLRSW